MLRSSYSVHALTHATYLKSRQRKGGSNPAQSSQFSLSLQTWNAELIIMFTWRTFIAAERQFAMTLLMLMLHDGCNCVSASPKTSASINRTRTDCTSCPPRMRSESPRRQRGNAEDAARKLRFFEFLPLVLVNCTAVLGWLDRARGNRLFRGNPMLMVRRRTPAVEMLSATRGCERRS